jgi:hypothetical protein
MKNFLTGLAIVLVLVFGGIAIKSLLFPVHVANKLVQTAYDATNKTLNADNAIYNYEWFKQQLEDINGAKEKYNNAYQAVLDYKAELPTDRKEWYREDVEEYNRLNSVANGTKQYVVDLVANYNARTKMANRAIFQDSILPSYIDALTFLKK